MFAFQQLRHVHCSARKQPRCEPEATANNFFAETMIKSTKKAKIAIFKPEPAVPIQSKPEPARAEPVKMAPVKSEMPKPERISIEFVRPGAKRVYVAGSFNGWKPEDTPLTAAGNGLWVGNLNVKPGRHEYLFVVDGQWLPDPNAKERVQNPFGGVNSVLTVQQ